MFSPFPPDAAAAAEASVHIDALGDRVLECIVDVNGWPVTFAATIEAARRVGQTGGTVTIAVSHRTEGDVLNLLTPINDRTIVLAERKRRFDAWFRLTLSAQDNGTQLLARAHLRFRGAYVVLAALPDAVLAPVVRRRMTEFLLLPLKRAAERQSSSAA